MTGTITINGSDATVAFEYTATTTMAQSIIEDAAHSLWNRGRGNHGTEETPITWDDLTAQDKVDIVDELIRETILAYSNRYQIDVAEEIARDAVVDYTF